ALIAMAIPLALDRARRMTLFVGPWAAAVVVMVAGLVTTTSRSGAVGVLAGCLAVVTFAVPRRFSLAAALLSAGMVALAILILVVSPLRTLNDDPASLRLNLWQDGLRLLAARPVTGWGEDATGLTFGRFLTQDYAGLVTFDRVHSGPIDVAVTQGVLGLAALAWVVFIVVRAAWRARSAPDVAGLAAALVGYSVWVLFNFDWAPVTGVFWLLAGTLWTALQSGAAPPHAVGRHSESRGAPGAPSLPRSARWRAQRAGGAIVLAVVAVPLAVLPLLADTAYLRGDARFAVQIDPLQAQYHWALGSVAELQRAADLGETDPGLYVQLGDGYLALGDRTQARRAYERALEIDPYYTPASQRLATLG
ncbi:MAG TPA: O-antigen ligase family protein, partial [Solirubrobacteraceae bacterium]|nr:O-antigen ligase family protein [Solirubrobacteraceae bacterium]